MDQKLFFSLSFRASVLIHGHFTCDGTVSRDGNTLLYLKRTQHGVFPLSPPVKDTSIHWLIVVHSSRGWLISLWRQLPNVFCGGLQGAFSRLWKTKWNNLDDVTGVTSALALDLTFSSERVYCYYQWRFELDPHQGIQARTSLLASAALKDQEKDSQ